MREPYIATRDRRDVQELVIGGEKGWRRLCLQHAAKNVRARRLLAPALEKCLVTGRSIVYLVKHPSRPT